MELTARELLRLHVEAVWGVSLPALVQDDIELLPESIQPPWKLCAAELADARVRIWRTYVNSIAREALSQRVKEALDFSVPMPGISREIALALVSPQGLDVGGASTIARPLSAADQALIQAFQANTHDDYSDPEMHPLIGVISAGRLLSLAHSSRRTKEACELGVDTLPEARRRGYALAVTILWTQAVIQEGLVPLYSLLAENTASLGLAVAAGYRIFARAATFES